MVAADDALVPSRSGSSLSLCSQSTDYTTIFGEHDVSGLIADVELDPADKDKVDGGLDSDSDDYYFDDMPFDADMLLTQTAQDVPSGSKRQRGVHDDPERPTKILRTANGSEAVHSSDAASKSSTIARTETDSTAVPSSSGTQPTLSATTASGEAGASNSGTTFATSGSDASSASAKQSEETPSPATLVPQATSIPASAFKPLTPVNVAHQPRYLKLLEGLPWGVRWEIARYVNQGFDFDNFTIEKLNSFKTTNVVAAPEVTRFVEVVKKEKQEREKEEKEKKEKEKKEKEKKEKEKKEKEKKDRREDEAEEGMRKRVATDSAPAATTNAGSTSSAPANALTREQSVKLPWADLDMEDTILHNHPHGLLGCNEDEDFLKEKDAPGWYGGKVHFTARVVFSKDRNDFRFFLDRPALESSNRFMRRFGSRRFIRVRIQKDALMQKGSMLAQYFCRPFVIAGAVFRAFFAKEQNVFLFRTNEVVVGSGEHMIVQPPADPSRTGEWSFMDFIKWHNDLELNGDQTMAKWAARFALGLSNSVPGIRLDPANIHFENDIICDAFDGNGKPPSEMQMTDGCGFANRCVMRALHQKFPWEHPPTAVQVRIGGAKGLLLVRHDLPPEQEEKPMIWLRPSQIKIKYTPAPLDTCILPEGTDLAMLTIDVLRASRMKCPANLSAETITNFAENGVPFSRFEELLQINIEKRVGALLDWDEVPLDIPPGMWHKNVKQMQRLWDALAREGYVMPARLAREEVGKARASGHVAEDYNDAEELDDEDGLTQLDTALENQSSAWWEDPISGCPSSLEETCMALIDAGFHPSTCPVLREKLKQVTMKVIRSYKGKYRFADPMSCSAFIVPDPYGVLGPNEVHIKSSHRMPDKDGNLVELIKGDVLVTRHPCKVPSDVQKVRAVEHPKLFHYTDVIVVSTASHIYNGQPLNRHLASLTGGGDYDGDTMEAIWDPKIVDAFQTPDPSKYAVEPPRVQESLLKNPESVQSFLKSIPPDASDDFRIYSLQRYLLGALQDKSLVGQYSTWWENSTYHDGYNHPNTIFLAYMFCAILDGSKSGVTINPTVYKEHCRNKTWQHKPPAWKDIDDDRERLNSDNKTHLKRPRTLPTFIMDTLKGKIKTECARMTVRADKKLGAQSVSEDKHLSSPWYEANVRAQELKKGGCDLMERELERIKEHVEHMYDEEKLSRKRATREGKVKSFTDLPIEKRQDVLRLISDKFHNQPTDETLTMSKHEAQRVKASYAYVFDREKSGCKWSRFPFNVALRSLCEIKAEALGTTKTVTHDFYRSMAISQGYLRKHAVNP